MGLFSLLFKSKTVCPLCKNGLNIKKLKEEGLVEILGKTPEGYIMIKH